MGTIAHILAFLDGDTHHAGQGLHAKLLDGFAALLLRAALLATARAVLYTRFNIKAVRQ